MFTIEVQGVFTAAHALRFPTGAFEPVHQHDFRVTVALHCQELDAMETVADFHEVERLLAEILAPWRDRNLNEVDPFCEIHDITGNRGRPQHAGMNTSAERIAEQIGLRLGAAVRDHFKYDVGTRGLRLVEVRLTEAPGCVAIWRPESHLRLQEHP